MSSKTHCDICDYLATDGGTVTSSAFKAVYGHAAEQVKTTDLCRDHFNAYRRLWDTWVGFEQGGMTTWPTRRVSEGR